MKEVDGHCTSRAIIVEIKLSGWFLTPPGGYAGVRARQEKVTFATVEDDALLQSLVRPLVGKRIRLSASAAGVQLVEYDGPDSSMADASLESGGAPKPAAAGGKIDKVSSLERLCSSCIAACNR